MTIKEMREHRGALEARLRNVAAEVVDEFQRRTGLSVDAVSIDLTRDRVIGDPADWARVTGARFDVRL